MSDPSLPTPRRAAIAFIFVTVTLDMLAVGMIVPILPKLVESFFAGDTAQAARIYGLFGTVWALMQFLFSPVLGALSDRFGRRPVILISNFGLGLDYVLMAKAPAIGWLLVGRIISGITAASITTAGAYVADVSPPERRAAGFGIIGSAFGLGFVLGPAIGGLLGGMNPRLPFWVAAGFSFANATYGLFVLPESLPKERRSAFELRRANPLGSLKLLRSYPGLLSLGVLIFIGALANAVLPSVFVLYASYRFAWGTSTVGLTLACVGVCAAVVQGALVRPLVSKFGERRVLLAGLLFGVAGFTVYGVAPVSAWIWPGIVLSSLWGVSGPALQSMMTKRVTPTEQGRLQGANSSILGISGLFGPLIFTFTFAQFIGPWRSAHLPGAPFLLSSLLLCVAFFVSLRVAR